jgi:hypothetical protein
MAKKTNLADNICKLCRAYDMALTCDEDVMLSKPKKMRENAIGFVWVAFKTTAAANLYSELNDDYQKFLSTLKVAYNVFDSLKLLPKRTMTRHQFNVAFIHHVLNKDAVNEHVYKARKAA